MTLDLISSNRFAVVVEDGQWAYQCVSHYVDLTILLRNLAVAGVLCAAWENGRMYSLTDPEAWHPGCRLDEYERMRQEAEEYAKWR